MSQFSLPKGYYVVVGRLISSENRPAVRPSSYPGRYLAEKYRCEARRLFFNRITNVWNPSDEPLHVIDSPPSMDAVREDLERIAGKDYLVWVAQGYNVGIGNRLLMNAVVRLQQMLNTKGVNVAKPLSKEALKCFANLRPSVYVDEPYSIASRKVRRDQAMFKKPWRTLDKRLGASTPETVPETPSTTQHS